MALNKDIVKNHENLSRGSVQFLRFASKHPGALRADHYTTLDMSDELVKLQPWPTFINHQTRGLMAEAGTRVFDLIKSIPSRVFANNREAISKYYGIPAALVEYILDGYTAEDIANLVARGDFILTADGLKCLEYNVNTNLGGMHLSMWESLYLNTPVIADFLRQYGIKICNKNILFVYFEQLLAAALARFPEETGEINIAVAVPYYKEKQVILEERYYNSIYKDVLAQYNGMKGAVFVCGYPELEVSAGCVRYRGKRVHSITEWYQGYVPAEILAVFKSKHVLIYTGPISCLLSTKLNLSLLSETVDSDVWQEEERALIRRFIPWARRVLPGESTYKNERIDLESFLLAHRRDLVLKPSLGSAGWGIQIGRYTPVEKWRELVKTALNREDWGDFSIPENISQAEWDEVNRQAMSVNSWVVQEYQDSAAYLYQSGANGCAEHSVVWGFYVFGSCYAASLVRTLPKKHDRGVINAHQGAKVGVVFEVAE